MKLLKLILGVLAINAIALMNLMALTYTVTPTTASINKDFLKYSAYNSYTKQYFMLRSYIDKLEAAGGGELILSKGTYVVPAALYVSSNITISFKDGVILEKGNKTGSTSLQVSKTLFQFVSRTKSSKTGSTKLYSGESNIRLIGTGTVIIDMKNFDSGISIVMGNNSNVVVRGITFKNSYSGNHIRISSCRNVTIRGNRFMNAKFTVDGNNDAIKLCTPDKLTENFPYAWSAQDKNPNLDISIKENIFNTVERAIGSNIYTEGVYHQNITITDNTIKNTLSDGIRALNWENVVMTGNTFTNISGGVSGSRGVLGSGVRIITANNNTFDTIGRPMQFMPFKNLVAGKTYKTTYNSINTQNLVDLALNTATSYKEGFIRINRTYGVFDEDTDFIFFNQGETSNFILTPTSRPFQGIYTESLSYNAATKNYFLLRSHMEALERSGGGTIRLKAGTYVISNVVYVPSNVTVKFDDGVLVRKGDETGTIQFDESLTMFECVRPSRAKLKSVYGLYGGETNIHFIGTGSATIDLNFNFEAIAITFGHNTNVSVKNLNFRNYFSGHFMEVDATRDIVISGNDFRNSKPSAKLNKEGINLDTPDKVTGGFTHDWSKYDRTPNKNVTIENNQFHDLDVAIGTHLYSQDMYHDNVIIRNNTFKNTRREAIRVLNWKQCFIENNTISDIADNINDGGLNRGLLISGAIYPTIRYNTLSNISRPMQLMPFQDDRTGYNPTYNTITKTNKTNFQTNTFIDITEPFIRINSILGEFVGGTEKLPITVTN